MADVFMVLGQDHLEVKRMLAELEKGPSRVTRPARQSGPQDWHSTWRKAPTGPAVRPETGAG